MARRRAPRPERPASSPRRRGEPRFTRPRPRCRPSCAATPPTSRRRRRTWSNPGARRVRRGDASELDRLEELRLAYVAITRAKDLLVASAHWWGPTQCSRAGRRPTCSTVREHCLARARATVARLGAASPSTSATRTSVAAARAGLAGPARPGPAAGAPRARPGYARRMARPPTLFDARATPVPATAATDADALRRGLGPRRRRAARRRRTRRTGSTCDVPLPAVAVAPPRVVRLARDPDGLARDLARPMPRPPAPAARARHPVPRLGRVAVRRRPLLDRTDLEGAADDDLVDDDDLAALQAAFLAGPVRRRAPRTASRRRSSSCSATGWSGAGSTPSTAPTAGTTSSTGRPAAARPTRCSWRCTAPRGRGSPASPRTRVGAAFYYVATGRVIRPDDLPGAAELERLLAGDALRPEVARRGHGIDVDDRRRSGRSPPVRTCSRQRAGRSGRGRPRAHGPAGRAVRTTGTSRARTRGRQPVSRAGSGRRQVQVAQ